MNLTDSDSSYLKLTFELNLIKLDLNFSHLTNLTLYHVYSKLDCPLYTSLKEIF